jgi:hypothetical protein
VWTRSPLPRSWRRERGRTGERAGRRTWGRREVKWGTARRPPWGRGGRRKGGKKGGRTGGKTGRRVRREGQWSRRKSVRPRQE